MTMLVVGLGNPGIKYEKTRHNLGFRVSDALARQLGLGFELKKKLKSEIAKNQSLILAKPQTFMNDSGTAVRKLQSDFRLPTSDILVIHDEIDLPFGKIRLSSGGSAGHQGVESIIKAVGPGFTRLRIGIENRKEYRVPKTESYILQKFTKNEEKILKTEIIPRALEEIKKILDFGF